MQQHNEPIFFLEGTFDTAFDFFLNLNPSLTAPPKDGDHAAHMMDGMRRAFHAGYIAKAVAAPEKAAPFDRALDQEEQRVTRQIDRAIKTTQV